MRLVACGWAVKRARAGLSGRAGGEWASGTEIERGLCPARRSLGRALGGFLGRDGGSAEAGGPQGLS